MTIPFVTSIDTIGMTIKNHYGCYAKIQIFKDNINLFENTNVFIEFSELYDENDNIEFRIIFNDYIDLQIDEFYNIKISKCDDEVYSMHDKVDDINSILLKYPMFSINDIIKQNNDIFK